MHVSDDNQQMFGDNPCSSCCCCSIPVEAKQEVVLRAEYRRRLARILYKNETILDEAHFNYLTTRIFEHRHVRNGTSKQWTFSGAFYFSTLVVTLIGRCEIFIVNDSDQCF